MQGNLVILPKVSLGDKLVAEKAELGLSLEMEKGERDPANAGVDAVAGGAALNSDRVRAESMPCKEKDYETYNRVEELRVLN